MSLKSGQLVTFATHMKPANQDIHKIYDERPPGLWIGRNRPVKEPLLVVSYDPKFRGLRNGDKFYNLTIFLSEGKLFKFVCSEDPAEHFVVEATIEQGDVT